MTQTQIAKLNEILDYLHANFTYVSDNDKYAVIEHWESLLDSTDANGRIVGDCDAFAIAARTLCKQAGFRARLIFCTDRQTGIGHVVCEVEGLILTNTSDRLLSLTTLDFHYKLISISGYNPNEAWRQFDE